MRYLLKLFVFHAFALWVTTEIYAGFVIRGGWQTIFFAGLILTVLTLLVKPLLKILFIPVNLLTFGLFSWIVNVLVLYMLTVIINTVYVRPWIFMGFTFQGFVVPSTQISYLASLIGATFIITAISNLLFEVTES
ncbi:phage holin family protein [Candidatus Gottesmanbacteria bacterium]|nr:phage holin family protein [Candidatus Gottesmanbacteria bacterium]